MCEWWWVIKYFDIIEPNEDFIPALISFSHYNPGLKLRSVNDCDGPNIFFDPSAIGATSINPNFNSQVDLCKSPIQRNIHFECYYSEIENLVTKLKSRLGVSKVLLVEFHKFPSSKKELTFFSMANYNDPLSVGYILRNTIRDQGNFDILNDQIGCGKHLVQYFSRPQFSLEVFQIGVSEFALEEKQLISDKLPQTLLQFSFSAGILAAASVMNLIRPQKK